MNNKAQLTLVWIIIFFMIVVVLFAMIEPLKENLNNIRGGSSLNCPGTPTFNQTTYDSQNTFEKLVYRPNCFVTGISMVWVVSVVLISGIAYVYNNWRKK